MLYPESSEAYAPIIVFQVSQREGGYKIFKWVNYLLLPDKGGFMGEAVLDARGRLTLPKPLRERYGNRFHIVETPHGLKLIPIQEDPLEALRNEFASLDEPIAQLREEARQDALEQAGE